MAKILINNGQNGCFSKRYGQKYITFPW